MLLCKLQEFLHNRDWTNKSKNTERMCLGESFKLSFQASFGKQLSKAPVRAERELTFRDFGHDKWTLNQQEHWAGLDVDTSFNSH